MVNINIGLLAGGRPILFAFEIQLNFTLDVRHNH